MPREPYESDTTRFIRDFLNKNPEIVEKQRVARSMWWDRKQDREQRKEFDQATVSKKPYEYY
jgi:hypothetical protein